MDFFAVFFFKQKKAYEVRISDWSSDVCSSDLSHTITWAVKDKLLAKEFKSAYSFEAQFDKLMQRANYNETNGIVVGPEFSRVFAEIILQRVDQKVIANLAVNGLVFNRDYEIRRYVDDFRSEEHTSELQSLMRISYAVFCL